MAGVGDDVNMIVEDLAAKNNDAAGGPFNPVFGIPSSNIPENSVHLAPPGFTVCETFFDSGEFRCFYPEVVVGSTTMVLPDDITFKMGDQVWCNVHVVDGVIIRAAVERAVNSEATVSVHVADITPDGVKQYHVGALVVPGAIISKSTPPDDVSLEVVHLGAGTEDEKDALALKGWHDGSSPAPSASQKLLESIIIGDGSTATRGHVVTRDESGEMEYREIENGVPSQNYTLLGLLSGLVDAMRQSGDYKILFNHLGQLGMAGLGSIPSDCPKSTQTVLVDARFDDNTKQLQVKRAKLQGVVSIVDITDWEMITGGQAVEHDTTHSTSS